MSDSRKVQYQIPPQIAASAKRPDICIYSEKAKKVCFVELTSPSEENFRYWQITKRLKYEDLISAAKDNGYKAYCKTIEVGARGYMSKVSVHAFSFLGIRGKKFNEVRAELTRVAIRCSHYIWTCRDNPSWGDPPRITPSASNLKESNDSVESNEG